MSDVFGINWAERMKNDPKANSILNNKINYQTYNTYRYWRRARDGRIVRNVVARPFKRRMNKLYSEYYTENKEGKFVNREGWFRRGGDVITYEDNDNKYWENTIPNSIFNHKSIANAENPKIQTLSSLPVYQHKM